MCACLNDTTRGSGCGLQGAKTAGGAAQEAGGLRICLLVFPLMLPWELGCPFWIVSCFSVPENPRSGSAIAKRKKQSGGGRSYFVNFFLG